MGNPSEPVRSYINTTELSVAAQVEQILQHPTSFKFHTLKRAEENRKENECVVGPLGGTYWVMTHEDATALKKLFDELLGKESI